MRCACCGGPFHPATGGLHRVEFTGKDVPFCGPCERDFAEWVVRHHASRVRMVRDPDGKSRPLKFYDHAYPPKEKA